jgi:Cohesin domain/PKD-like domain/Secretion system C-terminal sorting domain
MHQSMKRSLQKRTFNLIQNLRLKTLTLTLLSIVMYVQVSLSQTTISQTECYCLDNATTLVNGQYRDTIIIRTGIPGQTWRVLNAVGFYNPQSAAPPANPILYFNNALLTEFSPGAYRLIGKRVSRLPSTSALIPDWSVLLSNSATGQLQPLSSQRQCSYPSVAATTITGDNEVCKGATESYSIPANTNLSNIVWSVTGGTIGSINGTNTIIVNWGNNPGNYSVKIKGELRSFPTQSNPCEFESEKLVSIVDVALASQIVGDLGNCIGDVEEYTLSIKNTAATWSVTLDSLGLIPSTVTVAPKVGDPFTKIITWPTMPGVYFLRVVGNYKGCPFTTVRRVNIVNEVITPMACNGQVNLSMNPSCELMFSPSQFLALQNYPNSSYDIIIRDIEADTIVPNGTIGLKYLNKTLEVKVQHECSGNACWGFTTIEDKSIPDLICPPNIDIECEDVTNFAVTGFPVMPTGIIMIPVPGKPNEWIVKNYDKCSDLVLSYTDRVQNNICTGLYSSIITRTWKIVDGTGNVSTCSSIINIFKASLIDVEFPGNWDTSTGPNPTLEACGNYPTIPFDEFSPNSPNFGHPHPNFTGYPTGVLCLNASVSFTDAEIPICGENSYKIVRKWTIVNHCPVTNIGADTIRILKKNQLITIMDTKPPVLTCPRDILNTDTFNILSTKAHSCGADWIVAAPTVINDCSATTWGVEFLIADSNGHPPTGGNYTKDDGFTKVKTLGGRLVIENLPKGRTWLRYTATDVCGNFTYCFTEVDVIDKTRPTPICDRNSIIAIGANGWSFAGVGTVDGGSHDNCELDYLKARRMDSLKTWESLEKNNLTRFTCADVGKTIIVELGVWDKSGNFNSCMAEVKVQDNLPPTITPPTSRTVPCTTDISNLNTLGVATATDNCVATITEGTPRKELNGCGVGKITRFFTATDGDGNTAVAQQIITITNAATFDVNDIDWPDTYSPPSACITKSSPDDLPRANGYPRFLRDTSCSQLVMAYEDVVFKFQDNVCVKILRTWTVIDWCQTSISNPNAGVYQYTQLIMLSNTKKPEFKSGCDTTDLVITQGLDCGANIKVKATAKDDCTDSLDLVFTYRIDEGNNGTFEVQNGVGNSIDRNFPAGTHRITWFVKDGCNNIETCSNTFTITDTKKPTPICFTELVTVVMPSTREVRIWASDYNKGSVDNCSKPDKITASFSPTNRNDISRTFTCDSLGGADSKDFVLKVYFIDAAGNSDFCTVDLRVQANDGACDTSIVEQKLNIRGNIYNEISEVVENVSIGLQSDQVEFPKTMMTAIDGIFQFEELPLYENYVVSPSKNDFPLNGVSTLDLVIIQRHVLGLSKLDSPYKIIAADVNNSEKVSASDLVELRKLILGIHQNFSNNQSWRFADVATPFNDPINPWPFAEKVGMDALDHSIAGLDFVAIKVGDVNQSAKVNNIDGNIVANRSVINIESPNTSVEAGQTFEVKLNASNLQNIVGMQYGFAFDPALVELVEITSDLIQISEENLAYTNIKDGIVQFSWTNGEGINIDGAVMSIKFKALKDIENKGIVKLDNTLLSPEIYTINSESKITTSSLGIQQSKNFGIDQFELFQNIPNPFNTTTQIGFTLPSNDVVTLKVYDLTGKLLHELSGEYTKGYNTITLDINDLLANGVMYYQLETESHSATRKMIVIK